MKRYKCPRCNRSYARAERCIICPDSPALELRKGVIALESLLYALGAAVLTCIVVFGIIPNLERSKTVQPVDTDIETVTTAGEPGLFTLESKTEPAQTTKASQTEATTTAAQTTAQATQEATTGKTTGKTTAAAQTPTTTTKKATTTTKKATTAATTTTKATTTTQKTTTEPTTTTRPVSIYIVPQDGYWVGNTLHIWVNADGTNDELGSFNVYVENTSNLEFEVSFSSNYAGRVFPLIGNLAGTVYVRGNGTWMAAGDSIEVQVTVTSKADRSKSATCWVVVNKSYY